MEVIRTKRGSGKAGAGFCEWAEWMPLSNAAKEGGPHHLRRKGLIPNRVRLPAGPPHSFRQNGG
jgi:hypothetical protein